MTPAQNQKFIDYVINYSNVIRNHISENSISDTAIEASLNNIQTCALMVIDRINKGEITNFVALCQACLPMGDSLFVQLCNDKDYEYQMNEWASKQREGHEIPY